MLIRHLRQRNYHDLSRLVLVNVPMHCAVDINNMTLFTTDNCIILTNDQPSNRKSKSKVGMLMRVFSMRVIQRYWTVALIFNNVKQIDLKCSKWIIDYTLNELKFEIKKGNYQFACEKLPSINCHRAWSFLQHNVHS